MQTEETNKFVKQIKCLEDLKSLKMPLIPVYSALFHQAVKSENNITLDNPNKNRCAQMILIPAVGLFIESKERKKVTYVPTANLISCDLDS